jgi:RNA polymerase sigma-70 factor, ECF subfamily
MDDEELIAAVAGGDDRALRALFSRHAPWLAGRLRRALPAADVEDVLQETFLAVWRGAARYRGDGNRGNGDQGNGCGAWLWGIARRQAALWLRRRGPVALQLVGLDGAEGPMPDDPIDEALSRVELADAVDTLGPAGNPQRETWRLMYVEDRTVAEVAELMGVPAGTVKSRAYHVRRLLRAALGRPEPLPGAGQQ